MGKPIVRIVRVDPLRLAYVNATGESPEGKAHDALLSWAESKGLLKDPSSFFLFGRNNPPPSPGKTEYGYDSGVTVEPGYEVESDMKTEDLPGGLYAVVRTNLTNITKMWEYLYRWVQSSDYSVAGHGLEEPLTPVDESAPDTMLLDLWLPIAK